MMDTNILQALQQIASMRKQQAAGDMGQQMGIPDGSAGLQSAQGQKAPIYNSGTKLAANVLGLTQGSQSTTQTGQPNYSAGAIQSYQLPPVQSGNSGGLLGGMAGNIYGQNNNSSILSWLGLA